MFINIYSAIKRIVKKALIHYYSVGKPQKKVLFDSFGGNLYSADPRMISEKLHEMYPDYEIIWALKPSARKKNSVIIPKYVRVVDTHIGYAKELATSIAYVTTEPLTKSFVKRKDQFIVQTWHGDRGVKKCLYEAAESAGHIRERIFDNEYTDLCVAGSDFGEERYRKAFGFKGEILKTGMPRNDKLINYDEQASLKIRKYFGVPEGNKVLTYAPTFRGHTLNDQKSCIDICRTLNVLNEDGNKWICLVRAHAYTKSIIFEETSDSIINVSEYPDMADILLITDMLITDYSSCAGDFLVRKKPIILAINDIEEYLKTSRSLYMNLEDTGFILSHNQDELDKIIRTTKEHDYLEACARVLSFYGTVESGSATEVICRRINEHYLNVYNRNIVGKAKPF